MELSFLRISGKGMPRPTKRPANVDAVRCPSCSKAASEAVYARDDVPAIFNPTPLKAVASWPRLVLPVSSLLISLAVLLFDLAMLFDNCDVAPPFLYLVFAVVGIFFVYA